MIDNEIAFYIIGMPEKEYTHPIISKFKDVIYRLNEVYSEIEEARFTINKILTAGND